ncbi:DUF6796 family protein [Porphyromonas sp.]|uniref:DUF6796 family protein n=1 Tax=Porphyromonas sp. TaxID=1924944 RepID=UPI0026DA9306|nr:DUF6796 family protein [Porphyromonas sp.]MDO4770813.1 hypothetical protein [Porphyromonas sp.]
MNKTLRWTAWAGLLGGLLMYCGDMLLYFTTEPFADFENEILPSMGSVPFARFFAGGLVAPFTTALYILGFYHLYLRVDPARKAWGKWSLVLLSIGMICGGEYHAFFPAFGIVSAHGQGHLIDHLLTYAFWLGGMSFVFMASGWLIYAYMILRRWADFPRWSIVFIPIVTVWLGELWDTLPEPFAVLIAGGWLSLIFAIFYVVALSTLKHNDKKYEA